MPFDERGDAVAPEGREHGPDLGAAGTLGGLRGEEHRLARLPWGEVGRVGAHRRPQRSGVPHQRDATVVGGVQPLVGIGGPRVGAGDPRDLPGEAGSGGCPEAEGAVDVDPRPVFAGPLDQRNERIARPAVNVASLKADDRGSVQAWKARRDDTPLVVDWQPQRAITAEADQAQRFDERRVGLTASHHLHRRRTDKP